MLVLAECVVQKTAMAVRKKDPAAEFAEQKKKSWLSN